MSRIEEINNFMLDQFKKHGIEDTTEHRLIFLKGLREEWNKDEDKDIEKSFYQMALSAEIFGLELRLMFSILDKSA